MYVELNVRILTTILNVFFDEPEKYVFIPSGNLPFLPIFIIDLFVFPKTN